MHQSQTPSHFQAPDRGTNCVQRTSDQQHTQADRSVNLGMTNNDTITGHYSSGPTSKDRVITPNDFVAEWLAGGDEGQQELASVAVGGWKERSSFSFAAAPVCACCNNALPEGHYPVTVGFAESDTCEAMTETYDVCGDCVGYWEALS